AEAVARQHASGRLTIRERVERLLDPGSFHEIGPQAGFAEYGEDGSTSSFDPANYVLGVGRIDGRPCVVGGEDFTQRGGSPTVAGFRKSAYAEELASSLRLPLVRFLEGGGGSVRGAAKGSGPRPAGDPVYATHRFVSIARALRTAPVVSAGLGAVAGLPAARLAASHLAIMTRSTSQVLVGGPALVERALGERKTKEELGGAHVHGRSGVVDLVVEAEGDVFGAIRRFLSYLPTRVGELAPRGASLDEDRPERREQELLDIIPRDRRRLYDMRRLLALVLDLDSVFEIAPSYGRSQVTALARLDGWPVGVFANDPAFQGGAMGAEDAQKVRRFLQLCQTFHLPVLSFVDEPGFMIGSQAEAAGTIRYGVEAICAAVETTVPWATVHVRKAYGVASAAHFGPGGYVLAWPSAESGPLPIEGGVAVAFKREIATAPDPDAKRRELEESFAKARSAFPRAESFSVHDLIDPRDTRSELCRWLELARPQLEREARRRSLDPR
ncbi:MAG TPA: carboxyl transferase domain-containing protein, partial [Thermoanaerobaculia bacterium]|nr:carboxyl transferase domain-containing protein [Thermoanaerobaculia bacterium]